MTLTNPGAGSLAVTFGFRNAAAGDVANTCARSSQPFKATRKGALTFR